MKLVGFGYRKNCFGERMFYQDEIITYSIEHVKKALTKMRKEYDFSFQVYVGESSLAIVAYDSEKGMYSVMYRPVWNISESKEITHKEIIALIKEKREEEEKRNET